MSEHVDVERKASARARPGPARVPRSLLALAVMLLLVLIVGATWTRDSRGVPDDTYWAAKMSWRNAAGVVLAGDSRTKLGASPAALEEVLAGERVLNFGFDRVGFSEAYLQASARVLDAGAPRRAIVLGITPHALSPGAVANNRFEHMLENPAPRSLIGSGRSHVAQLYHRFTDPIEPRKALLRLFAPELEPRHVRIVHADGWVESDLHPPQPEEGFDTARRWFQDNAVSEDIVAGLIEQVARWNGQGIEVWAYRPPSLPRLAALEDELGRFDEAGFRARFEAAGGRWIDLGDEEWITFDSSHLTGKSARRMSRLLGAALLRGRGEAS